MQRAAFVAVLIAATVAVALNEQPGLEAATRRMDRAVLGAPFGAWVHALGHPMKNSSQRVALWEPCTDGTTPHLTVRFAGGRAVSMTGGDCPGETIDTPARRADAVVYMPQDAIITPTLSFSFRDSSGYTWPVAVYRSAQLGRMLPALDFQDCNGNPMPPGTLFLDLHMSNNQGWTMGVGTCMQ